MSNMLQTIVPKTDQLNADCLVGGPITITITRVNVAVGGEQPVTLNYEGDNGKPYKPCKSMRRVLVQIWGPDGNQYVGRSLTIYRDEKVQFGGAAVGGIRISHMSHITEAVTMALTATRANRKPFTVRPLVTASKPAGPNLESLASGYATCSSKEQFDALEADRKAIWSKLGKAQQQSLKLQSEAAAKRIADQADPVADPLARDLEQLEVLGLMVDFLESVNLTEDDLDNARGALRTQYAGFTAEYLRQHFAANPQA